jgi:hypothetical protein
LLDSGIQESSGGFARFYDAEKQQNKPVSTEISGYVASGLVYLFRVTGDEAFLDAAKKTAAFLVSTWDSELQLFPFEWPSPSAECEHRAYFFDTGIIIRGLLAVYRETGDARLVDLAQTAALGMIREFRAERDYHPILSLPARTPLPRTKQWSRSAGCYQLKAAMAWWDVAEITGDSALRDAYLAMLGQAMQTHSCFLQEAADRYDAMDRLHAYAYFLEGLLPVIERPECRKAHSDGLQAMQRVLDDVEPTFVRSDVYAQWLRASIFAGRSAGGFAGCDACVAEKLAAFQITSDDPRASVKTAGGFWFGRRDGKIAPQVNPVSTVFAMQALEMQRGASTPCRTLLI